MFGTLKPHSRCISQDVRDEYQRYYCGLCQGLGARFGLPMRGLVSHDAVFVALVLDDLSQQPGGADRTRCPMMPVLTRPTVSPDSPALACAAGLSVLLADQRLADWEGEGARRGARGQAARVVRGLGRDLVHDARVLLASHGVQTSELVGFEGRQAAVERLGVGLAAASAPTASALEYLFGRLASARGLQPVPDGARVMGRLGQGLGQAIYLLDALEDAAQDLRSGAFNPCIEEQGISVARVAEAQGMAQRALRQVTAALDALPLTRHRPLLDNVVQVTLRQRTAQAAARLTPARCLELQADLARPWPLRLARSWGAGLAALCTALAAWVVALPTRTRQRLSRTAQALRGGERPLGARAWSGALVFTGADQCPCDDCGKCFEPCNQCGKCCDNCTKPCDACGDCADKCSEPCKACEKCGDGCSSGCGNCGESCSGCGQCKVNVDPTPFYIGMGLGLALGLGLIALVVWLIVRSVRKKRLAPQGPPPPPAGYSGPPPGWQHQAPPPQAPPPQQQPPPSDRDGGSTPDP